VTIIIAKVLLVGAGLLLAKSSGIIQQAQTNQAWEGQFTLAALCLLTAAFL